MTITKSATPVKHICFSITHHGFGHGAISCAVMAQLQALAPGIKLTILSTIPLSYFTPRLQQPFDLIPIGSDFGMVMHSAISVDVASSERQYTQLQQEWSAKVAAEQALLANLNPDLVISNISPITLAAAHNLAIPSISICPFNWSQILANYSNDPGLTNELIPLMDQAYASVVKALKPQPHVPNPKSLNELAIGPICQAGNKQRTALRQALGISLNTKIGLIALGGLSVPMDLSQWPEKSDWIWLVDQASPAARTDMRHYTDTDMAFLDLVFSVDLVITKPGYGTYTELALAGTKAITLARPDWPETPYLNQFLSQYISCSEIPLEQLVKADFNSLIDKVMATSNPAAPTWHAGASEAADYILKL
ncbi:hypothetical protein K6Y31_17285 [Motilimonas cestriensis]|uniref:Glycosyl transferase family 28 C-terminal domain-containing protein n=1 Tax=Motilimonas cestriensis TaxID=2742685 RepID=A0ABS8WBZ9_9GAMM|nr:hypothetical protein [Motilimonas cestriensis]MCE2596551.1 hypothetical protein [Motilimonas cestriensis]